MFSASTHPGFTRAQLGLIVVALGVVSAVALPSCAAKPAQSDKLATVAETSAQADLKLIKSRYYARYLNTDGESDETRKKWQRYASKFADSMQPDGSWQNIDYTDRSAPGLKAMPHLDHLVLMARAYRTPGNPAFGDKAWSDKIHRAMNFWFAANPTTKHDWYNVIGVPLEWMKIAVLMEDELNPAERDSITKILRRADENGQLIYAKQPATGQNLTWIATAQIVAAALDGDADKARSYADQAMREIAVTTDEGIQADGSFHQHGPQLYAGGYGATFARDNAELFSMLGGTRLAPKAQQIEILSDLVLDGQRWMVRGDAWDYNVIGREIARRDKGTQALETAAEYLATLDTPRKSEFVALAAQLDKGEPKTSVSGNRAFWRSDFVAHQRPDYYAGLKMSSPRTFGNESGNGENILGYHLGDGAFSLLKSGDEYAPIFPLWDWKRVPGTTVAYDDATLPLNRWGKGSEGAHPFAGAVSNGTFGVSGFDFEKDGVRARKATFFFDDVIAFLGAGISGDKPVVTSVDQCRAAGDAMTENAPLGGATEEFDGAQWVLNNGVAYVFARGVGKIEAREKTGSWKTISESSGSSAPVKERVFSVWLEHGQAPKNASYEYWILPKSDAARAENARENPPTPDDFQHARIASRLASATQNRPARRFIRRAKPNFPMARWSKPKLPVC